MIEDKKAILTKLRAEWKTFVLAVLTTAAGAWQFAVDQGANLPNLLSWVKDEYKSVVYFAVGLGFLFLRRWTPVVAAAPTTIEPEATVTETK